MKKIFALMLAVPLFAVNLIDIKSFIDKNESVNITLSFDGAFNGEIAEKRDKEAVLLTLNGVNYGKKETRTLNSPLISEMLISPDKNKTSIMLKAAENVRVNAEKINNGTGIMVRALSQNAQGGGLNLTALTLNDSQQSVRFQGYDFTNYVLILVLLFVLLGIFWWLSRSLKKGRFAGKEFRVLFQRPLDKSNKFAIIEYDSKRYTMILGTSNILLDSIDLNEANSAENLANLGQNSGLNSSSRVNSGLNSGSNSGANSGASSQNSKNDKKQRSFESFFEENKQRLQRLIKGKEENPQN